MPSISFCRSQWSLDHYSIQRLLLAFVWLSGMSSSRFSHTPLVERGKGILELPLHLMLPPSACFTVIPAKGSNQDALPPNVVSMFWHCYDDVLFDPTNRDNNQTKYSLFTFDIIKSLSERERDFLIHARLGHLPQKKILQMIKNGTTRIKDYSGIFKELCKPCMQAKQRAENHGHEHKRHPKGRIETFARNKLFFRACFQPHSLGLD
jgi:hypothetical protein